MTTKETQTQRLENMEVDDLPRNIVKIDGRKHLMRNLGGFNRICELIGRNDEESISHIQINQENISSNGDLLVFNQPYEEQSYHEKYEGYEDFDRQLLELNL
jgi:hypothetical protein